MHDLKASLEPVSSNHISIVPAIDYRQAALAVCKPYIRTHKDIRSYRDEEPSRILEAQPGTKIHVDFQRTHDKFDLRTVEILPTETTVKDTYLFMVGKSVPLEGVKDQMDYLVERGNQCFSYDPRGWGLSSKVENPQIVHVNDFIEYGFDMSLVMNEVVLPRMKGQRLIVVAYSTGAAVTIMAMARKLIEQDNIAHFFPMAPLVSAKQLQTFKGRAALRLNPLALRMGLGTRRFWDTELCDYDADLKKGERYTHDRAAYESAMHQIYKVDERFLSGPPSHGWVDAYHRNERYLRSLPEGTITVPTTAFLANSDQIVVNRHRTRLWLKSRYLAGILWAVLGTGAVSEKQ
jgi:alpha-beta hydrolase superfamily lysophospholipase